jgi:hypothetical protein
MEQSLIRNYNNFYIIVYILYKYIFSLYKIECEKMYYVLEISNLKCYFIFIFLI